MKRLSAFVLVLMILTATTAWADELAIGAAAPAFTLTNAIDGKSVRFVPAGGSPSVIVFMCNTCPFAKAFESRLVELANRYGAKGVTFYSVNSSADSYPAEAPGEMKKRAAEKSFPFAYLKDGDSAVARAFGARVTPHVFVIDGEGVVRYRGYVDDSAKADERTHEGLAAALDALLAGAPITKTETKAFGCGIKFASE
jgi:peroxiredoxin